MRFRRFFRPSVPWWLCFFIAVSPHSGQSQNSTGMRIMGIPQAFFHPEPGLNEDNIMGMVPCTLWQVFSDRSNNPLYADPEGRQVSGRAGFMDPFYVNNAKGDFLHVYTDPQPDEKNNCLSKAAVDKGWIKKTQVLLWRTCLINDKNKAYPYMQVLTLGEPDFLLSGNDEESTRGLTIYRDPSFNDKTSLTTNRKDLYFVYKMVNGALLIGTERRIPEGSTADNNLVGWVPADYTYFLNSRLWLMPAGTPQTAVKNDSIYPPILFIDRDHALDYQRTGKADPKYAVWQPSGPESADPVFFPVTEEKDHVLRVQVINESMKTGFGVERVMNAPSNSFRKVTFISYTQLNQVLKNFQNIVEQSGEPPDRLRFKDAVFRYYKENHDNITNDSIAALPLVRVLEDCFWFIRSESPWLQLPAKELSDPDRIPDSWFSAFFQSVLASEKRLSRIVNTEKYDGSIRTVVSNNSRYLWIDVEQFP